MVPPFLAYYGALTGNLTLLQEAYDQIKLYRKYLLDKSTNNVWRHIQNGEYGIDNGHWSTGACIAQHSIVIDSQIICQGMRGLLQGCFVF